LIREVKRRFIDAILLLLLFAAASTPIGIDTAKRRNGETAKRRNGNLIRSNANIQRPSLTGVRPSDHVFFSV